MPTPNDKFMPMTDEQWIAYRPRGQCEAPGCTGRGRRRAPDSSAAAEAIASAAADAPGAGRSAPAAGARGPAPVPELRDQLVLCVFHHRAIATGRAAIWGEPPLDVLWRLGIESCATWYRNERRLNAVQVAAWFRAHEEG